MPKKEWKRPKLIILERISSEEAVLAVCKTSGIVGPTMIYAACSTNCPPAAVCSGVGSA